MNKLNFSSITAWFPSSFFLSALLVFSWAALPLQGTTVVPPQFDELVNESDYIVRAVVKSVRSEWREKNGHRSIFTSVELDVLEVINGQPPQPLILEMLGGRVGDEELLVEGLPKFAVGQEDILFIRGNGRQFYPLTAAMHGRYPIHREKDGNSHMARSNHEPLRDIREVALPMGESSGPEIQQRFSSKTAAALTPAQFTQQIRNAVDKNYHRAP